MGFASASNTGPVVVLGAAGQDGSYLCDRLVGAGVEVVAVVRDTPEPHPNLGAVCQSATVVGADLADPDALVQLITTYGPSTIYNFAAVTFGPDAWAAPTRSAGVSVISVAAILEAVRRHLPTTRVFQASSAWIFGMPDAAPQDEETEIRPVEPYGAAKAFATFLVNAYRRRYGLFACSGIFYNHESPRRPPRFVTRKITRAVAAIKLGLEDCVVLGDLDSERDWGYAPDFVNAAVRMLAADEPADYVVATGEGHTVREFAEIAFSAVGLDASEYLRTDDRFMRPATSPVGLIGNATKARRELGWSPSIGFGELVRTMVDADLAALEAEPSAYAR